VLENGKELPTVKADHLTKLKLLSGVPKSKR